MHSTGVPSLQGKAFRRDVASSATCSIGDAMDLADEGGWAQRSFAGCGRLAPVVRRVAGFGAQCLRHGGGKKCEAIVHRADDAHTRVAGDAANIPDRREAGLWRGRTVGSRALEGQDCGDQGFGGAGLWGSGLWRTKTVGSRAVEGQDCVEQGCGEHHCVEQDESLQHTIQCATCKNRRDCRAALASSQAPSAGVCQDLSGPDPGRLAVAATARSSAGHRTGSHTCGHAHTMRAPRQCAALPDARAARGVRCELTLRYVGRERTAVISTGACGDVMQPVRWLCSGAGPARERKRAGVFLWNSATLVAMACADRQVASYANDSWGRQRGHVRALASAVLQSACGRRTGERADVAAWARNEQQHRLISIGKCKTAQTIMFVRACVRVCVRVRRLGLKTVAKGRHRQKRGGLALNGVEAVLAAVAAKLVFARFDAWKRTSSGRVSGFVERAGITCAAAYTTHHAWGASHACMQAHMHKQTQQHTCKGKAGCVKASWALQ
eukprot:366576-Chlamydomonas_euryale.AAC.14